ncbi:MAG TPA: hypothetical protein VGD81_12725 [Opitutaceae bacterium]
MKRLRILLGFSHLLVLGGATGLYLSPSAVYLILLGCGVFVRWMVPSRSRKAHDPLETYSKAIIVGVVTRWLFEIVLADFIQRAWGERFSILPVIAFFSLLLYLALSDWRWFLRLEERDVDLFYHPKSCANRNG